MWGECEEKFPFGYLLLNFCAGITSVLNTSWVYYLLTDLSVWATCYSYSHNQNAGKHFYHYIQPFCFYLLFCLWLITFHTNNADYLILWKQRRFSTVSQQSTLTTLDETYDDVDLSPKPEENYENNIIKAAPQDSSGRRKMFSNKLVILLKHALAISLCREKQVYCTESHCSRLTKMLHVKSV